MIANNNASQLIYIYKGHRLNMIIEFFCEFRFMKVSLEHRILYIELIYIYI